MAQTYIGYSPDVEVLGEDEERLTAEILEIMATTNRRAFERHRHAVRDAHAKSHGFLKGELIVHELPSHLRQGLFGLVTVLCRSPISLCHLGFERERADAAQI